MLAIATWLEVAAGVAAGWVALVVAGALAGVLYALSGRLQRWR